MARYGQQYYGQFYGDSLVSGTYTSKVLDCVTPLTGTATLTVVQTLPTITLQNTSTRWNYQGTWTTSGNYNQTSVTNSTATVYMNMTSITIVYGKGTDGGIAQVNAEYIDENGIAHASTLGTIDMYAGSTTTGTVTYTLAANEWAIEIKATGSKNGSSSGYVIRLDYATVQTTSVTYSARASTDNVTWTSWAEVAITPTANPNEYQGTTANYNGKRYIQSKAELRTGDSSVLPAIDSLLITTSNTSNYTSSGTWIKQIDLGGTFSTFDYLEWSQTTPTGTSVTYTTRSSPNGSTWSVESNPYTTEAGQAQLAPGQIIGTVTTPVLTPESNTVLTTGDTTYHWDTVTINAYVPNEAGAVLTASLLNNVGTALVGNLTLNQAYDISQYREPVKVKLNLQRQSDQNTPYVTSVVLNGTVHYKEPLTGTGYISKVDGDGTGIANIEIVSNLGFTVPVLATQPTYTLVDNTGRSQQVLLYYGSEENLVSLTNQTLNSSEQIKARATAPVYFQYGRGQALYGNADEETLFSNLFVRNGVSQTLPSVGSNKYKYLIHHGWVNENMSAIPNTINNYIELWWGSDIGRTLAPTYSIQATANGDSSNDAIMARSTHVSVDEQVAWISESTPVTGTINNYGTSPVAYSASRTVPAIPTNVAASNPAYVVTLDAGSVLLDTEDGRLIPAADDLVELTGTFPETTISIVDEPVVRGAEAGGADYLLHSRVIAISKIASAPGGTAAYTINTSYVLSQNRVSWQPGGSEPAAGTTYYVSYTYKQTTGATITASGSVDCKQRVSSRTYFISDITATESGTVTTDESWLSDPLPGLSDDSFWTDLPNDIETDTLHYVVSGDNQRVAMHIADNQVTAEVKQLNAKERWSPLVTPGYYYTGGDQYYLFADPVTLIVPDDATVGVDYTLVIPVAIPDGAPVLVQLPNQEFMRTVFTVDEDGLIQVSDDDAFAIERQPDQTILYFNQQHAALTIIYEGSAEAYVATDVSFNPTDLVEDEGFIYVTNANQTVAALHINSTPDVVKADGIERVHIVVDAVDRYGNLCADAVTAISWPTYGSLLVSDGNSGYTTMMPVSAQAEPIWAEGGRSVFIYVPDERIGNSWVFENLVVLESTSDLSVTEQIRLLEVPA